MVDTGLFFYNLFYSKSSSLTKIIIDKKYRHNIVNQIDKTNIIDINTNNNDIKNLIKNKLNSSKGLPSFYLFFKQIINDSLNNKTTNENNTKVVNKYLVYESFKYILPLLNLALNLSVLYAFIFKIKQYNSNNKRLKIYLLSSVLFFNLFSLFLSLRESNLNKILRNVDNNSLLLLKYNKLKELSKLNI